MSFTCHSLCHSFYRYWLIIGSSFGSRFPHYLYLFVSLDFINIWFRFLRLCHLTRHYFPWKLFLRLPVLINIIKMIFSIFCRYISSYPLSLFISLFLSCIFVVCNLINNSWYFLSLFFDYIHFTIVYNDYFRNINTFRPGLFLHRTFVLYLAFNLRFY